MGLAIRGAPFEGAERADIQEPHRVELSPSMADSISSSYESSSDRPLGDALLESDTHKYIIPGATSTCAEGGVWTR